MLTKAHSVKIDNDDDINTAVYDVKHDNDYNDWYKIRSRTMLTEMVILVRNIAMMVKL